MKMTLLAVAATLFLCAPAAQAERLSDKQVEALIARIASQEDAFRDALDPTLKRAVIRNATGEYNVERILKDFSDAAERLKDRFKKDYSASTEATDLLRQSTTIDNYFHRDQAATRGESEWNGFATNLKALAAAYGTEFPLPAGATARRISDKEVIAAAESLSRDADRLKKAVDSGLKQNKAIDKATRTGIVGQIDMVRKDAAALKSAVGGGKPASAQATQLLGRLSKINDFLGTTPVAAASPITGAMGARAGTIAQAFGMPS
jgi:hypothetical protein